MAFSSSSECSQNTLVCGLCDTNATVRVKCIVCDLYLCDDCKVRHSRFKHADSLSVIAIRDIHLHNDEDRGQEEFKPVKCKIHKAQFSSIFCKSCDDLICPICIVETHQNHELEKIEIICKQKCEDFKNLKDAAQGKTQMFLQGLHSAQKNEIKKGFEIERILELKIKAIQDLHTRHAKELGEIKEFNSQLHVAISRTEDRISNEQEAIREAEIEMEESLKSRNVEKILDTATHLKTRLKTFSETIKPNKQKMNTLQSISGDFSSAGSTFTDTKIELTKLKSFPIGKFSICSITSNQMNSVWITDAKEGKIQHLELREDIEIIQTRKLPDSGIPEIRCFSENEILLASLTKIVRLTADGNFKTFKDFSPSKVLTLHVTITGDIVVGMNLNQIDNKTKQDRPVIVILGNDGKTKSEYMDSCGQLLKNDIVRCCTVLDGDAICYIDSAIGLPCNGRLVVLNKSGYIQWTYNGNSTIITENHPFTPIEVISTKNNNIITSDMNQNAVHILTSTGSLLTVLDLSLLGIKTPGAMSLVNSQFLWMTGKDNDDNRTLFKLEISGV